MRSNGRDWSRHQARTDVELIADDVDYIMARCTIGWSYRDAWYAWNFMNIKAAEKLFGAYHVLWPENNDPKREAQWFAQNWTVDGEVPDFVICDDELMQERTPANVLEQCRILAFEVGDLFGAAPRIYTGSWFWNRLPSPGGWENQFPLIEAEYLTPPLRYPRVWRTGEDPQPPKAPGLLARGWDDWWMWQWTSKMEGVGVESKTQDADVFNGTYQQLLESLDLAQPPLTYNQKTDILWSHHPELHSIL